MAYDEKTAEVISEAEHLRSELSRYREAALIGYGALLARPDGNRSVIALLSKYLAPDLGADQIED